MGSQLSKSYSRTRQQYDPTTEDVFLVRGLLLRFLPTELANTIIDDARYWPRILCKGGPFEVCATGSRNNDATECCVVTPRIADSFFKQSEAVCARVREVRFTTESHDQGWCHETGFTTDYQGSWTWFEAIILRDLDSPRSPLNEEDTKTGVDIKEDIRRAFKRSQGVFIDPKLVAVLNPTTKTEMWHIQRNVRANVKLKKHEVRWTVNDLDGKAEEERIHIDATGAGLGAGFVQSLESWDRIVVLARAVFPGWINVVEKVEVEIYFSV